MRRECTSAFFHIYIHERRLARDFLPASWVFFRYMTYTYYILRTDIPSFRVRWPRLLRNCLFGSFLFGFRLFIESGGRCVYISSWMLCFLFFRKSSQLYIQDIKVAYVFVLKNLAFYTRAGMRNVNLWHLCVWNWICIYTIIT